MGKRCVGILVTMLSITVISIASAVKAKKEAEYALEDLKLLIEKSRDMDTLVKRLHFENIKKDNDMLAATIVWIDYKFKNDYLSELLGFDDDLRKDVGAHKYYTKADLDELSYFLETDEVIYHEALKIVASYLPEAPMDILKITPMNCLYSYL